MDSSKWVYLLSVICFSAQCNSRNVKDTNKTEAITGVVDCVELNNVGSFKIDSIEFVGQNEIEDTVDLKGVINVMPCSTPYAALKEEEIADEFKLFSNQILYYSYRGDVIKLLNDSVFMTKFYKKVINESDEHSQMGQLRFVGVDTVNVISYGVCIVASFRYLTPISANQDEPVVIFNDEKKEIIIWSFSDWRLKKGVIELDFKIRNEKHTLYQVEYNGNIKRFIPNCYRVLNKE